MNTFERICSHCHNTIVYKTLGHRNYAEKRRSLCRMCQSAEWNLAPNTKCYRCDKPIYRKPHQLKRTPHPFCSFSCKNKFYYGPKAFAWKGGKSKYQKRQHERQKELKNEKKRMAIDLLGGKCELCGYNKCVAALDFHHIDPSQKESDLKHLMHKRWAFIEREIKKCKLLCSNCHRELHWKENNE